MFVEKKLGLWIKDGVRYGIQKEDGQTQEEIIAEAEASGYILDEIGMRRLRKKTELAAARYAQEMGGFQLPPEQGGLFVRTDARNRTLLNAAALRATSDPAYEVPNWKTADGAFITLTNSMILSLDQSVRDFIAACFAKEASLCSQIDSTTTIQEVNAIVW